MPSVAMKAGIARERDQRSVDQSGQRSDRQTGDDRDERRQVGQGWINRADARVARLRQTGGDHG